MRIEQTDYQNKTIAVAIPLTDPTGKARVKKRDIWYGYGEPVATKSQEFGQNFYIEWQIGYDIPKSDNEKLELTQLRNKTFIGSNGKEKVLYELSEYLYYFYDMGIISIEEIENLLNEINQIDDNNLIERNSDLSVERSHPVEYGIEGINFQKSIIQYSLLLYKISSSDILIEIIVKERQSAVGLQPMLFVCVPITELRTRTPLIGRCAQTKEIAYLMLNESHKDFILQTFKLFALLSINHKNDVLSIIKSVLE